MGIGHKRKCRHEKLVKRMASARSRDELDDLKSEMIDRFGLLPDAARTLFDVTALKIKASPLGVSKIDVGAGGGRLVFGAETPVNPENVVRLVQEHPGRYRLDGADRLRMSMELPELGDRLTAVNDLLRHPGRRLSGPRLHSHVSSSVPRSITRPMLQPRLANLAALSALLLLVAVAPTAQAYTVEIIVFAHPGGDARFSETWRPDPGTPDVSRASPVSAGNGVRAVGPSSYRMHGIWQALRGSPGYRPLRHMAWVQGGTSRDRAPVVLLGEDPGIAGVRNRACVARALPARRCRPDLPRRRRQGPCDSVSHRRMKSNEIHYMDHPLFGVLVVVSK